MPETKIEWADDTENAASGCSEARLPSGKMDPACVNCYARLQSARCGAMGMALYDGVAERTGNAARWSGVFRWERDMLQRKFDRMKGGHRVFLGSMTDLWHPDHDPALLVALAGEIRRLGQRQPKKRPIVITLTKRADRLLAWQREHFPEGLPAWVWPGVTAGCQEAADLRVPVLLQVRAAGPRVVSVEPMTGPVDLTRIRTPSGATAMHNMNALRGYGGWGDFDREKYRIGWVIAGGMSGLKATPTHPSWLRAIRDDCFRFNVPFHLKQHGEWAPARTDSECLYPLDGGPPFAPRVCGPDAQDFGDGFGAVRIGKAASGRMLDGRTYDGMPEVLS
jgi:protein gp37